MTLTGLPSGGKAVKVSPTPEPAVAAAAAAPAAKRKGRSRAASAASHLVPEWADVMASYSPTTNRSRNVLTKYERAKVIGVRIEQLAHNATPFVDIDPAAFDVLEIAERELRTGRLPFVVVRRMPDGSQELWRLADMIV
jgi:DNA-directed RNA polymerase subunit K/omega